MSTADAVPASRGRLLAFRIIAILGAVALGGFALVFLVLTFVDDEQDIHALHNVAGVAAYVPLFVVPLIAALRDAAGTAAWFRVSVAGSLGIFVAGVIGGTVESALVTLVVVALLLWLHPARAEVLRLGSLDVSLLAIVAVAAIPAAAYGLDQADLQATYPDDVHSKAEHYAGMAGVALGLVLAGAVAAFRGRGDRIARWLVGLGGAATAAAFLAYPDRTSAIDPIWAAAALVVSVLYVAVAEILARRAA